MMKFEFKNVVIFVCAALLIMVALYKIFDDQERALFKIKESDTLETTLYYQDQTNYYLYGLDEVEVTYQNEKKSLKEFLEDGTTIDTLVQDRKNEELSDSIGTLYYVGEANILVCHKNNENSINNNVYIGNKDMKYEEEFCRGE